MVAKHAAAYYPKELIIVQVPILSMYIVLYSLSYQNILPGRHYYDLHNKLNVQSHIILQFMKFTGCNTMNGQGFFWLRYIFIIHDRLSSEGEKNHWILKALQEKRHHIILGPIKENLNQQLPLNVNMCLHLYINYFVSKSVDYIQVKDTTSELMMISRPIGWKTPLILSLNLSNLWMDLPLRISHNTPSFRTSSSVGLKVARFSR